MLIRSQNRKALLNLENISCIQADAKLVRGGGFLLGEYSTEEKAIKVLGMIQREYLRITEVNLSDAVIARGLPKAVVFEMPQDSEV